MRPAANAVRSARMTEKKTGAAIVISNCYLSLTCSP
jgi:hypothetical protein